MPDLDKVIKGLECCHSNVLMTFCPKCPYEGPECFDRLKGDALELLKAQVPISFEGTHLNREDYVNIGDIIDCLSEITLDDDAVIHAVGLIEWAMGKRAITKEDLLKCGMLDNAPTVDAVEVKHGRWQGAEMCDAYDLVGVHTWALKLKCSICGFTHKFIEAHMSYAFCPSCGAKMEEEA